MCLALLLLVALFTAEARAQQPAKVHQLGYLSPQSPIPANRAEALRMGLRDLGHVEGKNIAIAFDRLKRPNGCPKPQPTWSA